MNTIIASPQAIIPLGRLGENEHTRITFDVEMWQSEYPGCHFTLINKRPGDAYAYPVENLQLEGKTLVWTVQSNALSCSGQGECELLIMVNDVVAKSTIYRTLVMTALDGSGTTPSEWENWLDTFVAIKDDIREAADRAYDVSIDETKLVFTPHSSGVL